MTRIDDRRWTGTIITLYVTGWGVFLLAEGVYFVGGLTLGCALVWAFLTVLEFAEEDDDE